MSLSSVALAKRPTGSVFIRGGLEYSGHSLDDLKDYQEFNNEVLADLGLPPTWENVGRAPGFNLELGYQIRPAISVGIGFAHTKHSGKNSSAGLVDIVNDRGIYQETRELSLAQDLGASISEITGNVMIWVPGAAGLFLGVQGGVGMGDYKETWTAVLKGDDFWTVDEFSSDCPGIGFVGGAFAGYDLAFSSGVSAFVKGGYRQRNLRKLKGRSTSLEDGEPAQHEMTYKDLNGTLKSVGFNFSGLFAAAGLGFSFGGAER